MVRDEREIVTWDKLHQLINVMAREIEVMISMVGSQATDYIVVGIEKGGVIPALMLSKRLDTMFTTKIESHEYRGRRAVNYLVVDDIADTGRTLSKIAPNLRYTDITATVHKRNSSKFTPDITGELITHKKWLSYPWERYPNGYSLPQE